MALASGPPELMVALALLGVLGISGVVIWNHLATPQTPTAQELAARFERVGAMSGAQFESFVADLFRAMGHVATAQGGIGDQGVDIILLYRGELVAVQCKNYKRAVGNKPVQEIYAGAKHHRCQRAWVVAPAGYTGGARDLARSTGVSLHGASSIRRWIRQVDRLEKERERVNQRAKPTRQPAPEATIDEKVLEEARKRAFWYPHPDDPPDR